MTGRTHDVAAVTALTYIVATGSVSRLTLATAAFAFGANLIGGVTPDIDQPTAKLWEEAGIGRGLAHLVTPLLGGHRYISHSLLGIVLFGFLSKFALVFLAQIVVFDAGVAWWAFMIGFVSHLIMDTFTEEGVPWLFPTPIKFGIPPLKHLRIKTGGKIEKYIVFPALILATGYLIYGHYIKFLGLFHKFH